MLGPHISFDISQGTFFRHEYLLYFNGNKKLKPYISEVSRTHKLIILFSLHHVLDILYIFIGNLLLWPSWPWLFHHITSLIYLCKFKFNLHYEYIRWWLRCTSHTRKYISIWLWHIHISLHTYNSNTMYH